MYNTCIHNTHIMCVAMQQSHQYSRFTDTVATVLVIDMLTCLLLIDCTRTYMSSKSFFLLCNICLHIKLYSC